MKKLITLLMLCTLGFSWGAGEAKAQTCQAGFSYMTNPNGVVTFFDSSWVSSGTITSWSWSFGNGTTGTGSQVTATYTPGTYWACLYITTSAGCSDSACALITVLGGCNVVATVTGNGNVLMAAASGGTAPYTYLWSNGQVGPVLTVVNNGVYCVTVTDSQGCTADYCYTYNGGTNCTGFGVNVVPDSLGGPLIWAYPYGGTAPYQYSWNTWSTWEFDTLTFPGNYCVTVYDANGCVANSCYQYAGGGSANDAFICGSLFNDVNGNGLIDSAEGPDWAASPIYYMYLYGSGFQGTIFPDSLGNFSFALPAGTYTLQACQQGSGWAFTVPTAPNGMNYCTSYSFTIATGDSICGFNFGLVATSSTICGSVYFDANNNGVLDGGETGIPYQYVNVGGYYAYTNNLGQFTVNVPVGTYQVSYTPSGNYQGYTSTGTNPITVVVTAPGQSFCSNNFGLYIAPGSVNLSISLNPHTTVTPGFPAWYDIQVCNLGATPVGGDVTMIYDPVLTFQSSTITPASVNTASNTITWNLPAIAPGSCTYMWIDFDASTATQLGYNAFNLASVNPTSGMDINLANNIDSTHQVAVGSWDPNNKIVNQTNTTDPNFHHPASLNPDQEISYTVNFQNTGTAPAVNVVVVDEISSNLVEPSYQLMGTSHNCTVQINGNTITYLFSNIMLPDSTNNEPASHGFINYKINADNGLVVGDEILDHAAIYFDFNAPVITNDALVTISAPLGDKENASSSLMLFPNPASEMIRIIAPKAEHLNIEIYSTDGRLVYSEQISNGKTNIDLSTFSNGMYVIKAMSGNHQWVEKLTVKH